MELTKEAKYLLECYPIEIASLYSSALKKIKVGEMMSPVLFAYERIRNVLDYRHENTIFRSAIERIIKRLLWEHPGEDAFNISRHLINELIWSKYIENNSLPSSKLDELKIILEKYFFISKCITSNEKSRKQSINQKKWLLSIISAEIEESINPVLFSDECLAYSMSMWIRKKFSWKNVTLSEKSKEVQFYIAINRSLLKVDDFTIAYRLIRNLYHGWRSPNNNIIKYKNFLFFYAEIFKHFSYKKQFDVFRFVKKFTAPFYIIKNILENKNNNERFEILLNSEKLIKSATEECKNNYKEIYSRVNRGIARSIIYIFFTKVVLAFLIEFPYDYFIAKKVSLLPLTINLVFPPLMMFFIGLSIRRPGENNTSKIVKFIEDFVYKERVEKEEINFDNIHKKGFAYNFFVWFYALTSFLVFLGISYLLYLLHFNVISAGIFFVYISLVLLFAYKVKNTAQELNVVDVEENFAEHLTSNITLPFLNFGRYISFGLAKFSILMIVLDLLIEAPLKNISKFFESWAVFIRERKDETLNTPV